MVWVLGGNGLLGKEICRELSRCDMPCVSSGREVDITQADALERFMTSAEIASFGGNGSKIKWIINCAAYTDVDKAESNAIEAERINSEGALNIARVARSKGSRLVHISTNYVFDGNLERPYTEDDSIAPLSVYGKTKAAGEENVAKEMTQYYILRTSSLYGFDKDNFVYSMVKMMNKNPSVKAVRDQKVSPTFAGDVAQAVIKLIQKAEGAKSLFGKDSPAPYGIYHYCDSGEATFAEYADAIRDIGRKCGRVARECQVIPCSTADYNAGNEGESAKRPANGVLDTAKIVKALKIHIPSWRQSLEAFMKSNSYKEC